MPTRRSFLQPSITSSSITIAADGAAHAGGLHGDRLPLPRAAVAEHRALGVRLHDVLEIRVGDVLRAQRVAGEEDCFGVIAGLGANVRIGMQQP